MPVSQETKPMRRLPDSSPRISNRLRFPILFFLAVDVSLFGLLMVILFTPLHPNYPVSNTVHTRNIPATVETVVLPSPAPPAMTHSAPVAHSQAAPVHRVTPTAHRPSTAPTFSTPAPTHSKPPSAYPTVTPPKPSPPDEYSTGITAYPAPGKFTQISPATLLS